MQDNSGYDFTIPLKRLSEVLGDSSPIWPSRENFESIIFWNEDFSRQLASSIPLIVYQDLARIFGNSLTFKYYLGGNVVLDLSQSIDQEIIERFQDQTRQAATLIFDFKVDKKAIIESYFPGLAQSCKTFLFIYSEPLEKFLAKSDLSQLETKFWDEKPDQKTVILVPEKPIFLNGPYFSIIGGEYLASIGTVIPDEPIDTRTIKVLYERCENSVKWQTSFLRHLTPLNLTFSILAGENDSITRALLIRSINIVLLYIADRSIIRNKTWISVFISSQQSVEIQLTEQDVNLGDNLNIGAQVLMDIFKWVYDLNWKVTDRLPLVQIGIVQALGASEHGVRYRLLIENARSIYDGLQWNWKAFIEGRVEEYVGQILDLEQFISDTVRAFAEQISSMTKSLNETMLAAVGVFIASFIAALFTTTFNPVVFRIGLLVYAGYILIFPMIASLFQQRDQFRIYIDDFELRRKRFEDRLFKNKVDQIIGKQIDKSTIRFRKAVIYTIITYLLVIFLLIAAAMIIPEFIQRSINEPQPTTTPIMTTPTVTQIEYWAMSDHKFGVPKQYHIKSKHHSFSSEFYD
jgi:hypothetical protein